MRTGLIAQKLGMTRVFDDNGKSIPVTLLKVNNCQVVSVQTEEKNGYTALQLGAGEKKVKRTSKAQRGHFAKAKVEPKMKVAEFHVDADKVLEIGAEIVPSHFIADQYVDVAGITLGKGFQGGMKRWNFGGLRATHGVSVSHRALGSTGQCQDPGRVFKGKKMAGQMGNVKQTTLNLRIVSVDDENGLIAVQGSIAGHKNGWVTVRDAVKKPLPKEVPLPAGIRSAAAAPEAVSAEV